MTLALQLLAIYSALVLHEIAHSLAALYLGDDTPAAHGRLSLNPLRHGDPIGTLVVPLLFLWTCGISFGWMRPLPVAAAKLRCGELRGMAIVAAAGPMCNLVQLLVWAIVWQCGSADVARIGVITNAATIALNMIPIAPLDGSHILRWIVEEKR